MANTRMPSAQGTLPWVGPRTGANYGKPEVVPKYHGHAAEAISRRTPEEREAILTERLAQLRAKPPIGSPFHPATRQEDTR
jgi:hypothetical protein